MAVNFSRIFFYCVQPDTPDNTGYPHTVVCLGEGCKALGIKLYSNVNYWQLSPEKGEYLFPHDPKVTPDDCDIVVLNHDWFTQAHRPLPKNLFHRNRKYVTVYMDGEDGNKTHSWLPECRQFDFIFKINYNSNFRYPSNVHPWAQGLSERMLRELKTVSNFSNRKRHIIVNFREVSTIRQSVRRSTYDDFLPRIQKVLPVHNVVETLNNFSSEPYHYLNWTQTGRRHSPNYYKSLQESVACACFTGYFVTPWPRDIASPTSRLLKRLLVKLRLKSSKIVDWDSWRFWESLAAGCVGFHEDFEKYGLLVPVMPKNWHHYIGIDFDNIQEAVDRIAENPDILEKIATEGRLWVLEHYTPVPTSIRFLETIDNKIS